MATSANLHDILVQAKQLDREAQLTLLQRLASLLKRTGHVPNATPQLSSLTGLGSELWKGADAIDRYIDEERQW